MLAAKDTLAKKDSINVNVTLQNPVERNQKSNDEWANVLDILVWPVIFLIVFFILRKQLIALISSISNLQLGSFAFKLNKSGKRLGIDSITKDLEGLAYEELRIFMIVCGENADYYSFVDRTKNHDKMKKIYERLAERGLIEFDEIEEENGKKSLAYKTTDKGINANRAVLDSLFAELINK